MPLPTRRGRQCKFVLILVSSQDFGGFPGHNRSDATCCTGPNSFLKELQADVALFGESLGGIHPKREDVGLRVVGPDLSRLTLEVLAA